MPSTLSSWATTIASTASGTLATSTGLSGPPVVILFNARGLEKDRFRITIAAYFIVFRLREPVAALTRAARDIGHGRTPPPLDDEDGPEELRTVSRAFS